MMPSSPSPLQPPRQRLGDFFVQAGLLTHAQVEAVVQLQQTERLRFGEAAVQLGFVSQQQVMAVLSEQFSYPTTLSDGTNISPLLAIAQQPFSTESEAIRHIRTATLVKLAEDKRPLSIAIVSPNAQEGRTYLAASLAVAFSQTSMRTLLVDASLRSADENAMYGLAVQKPSEAGKSLQAQLPAMLAGWQAPRTQPVPGFPHLSIVPAGPQPPNPLELLAPPRLQQLLEQFKADHDVIIVDTPPALESSDALVIARQTDISIVLAKKDATSLKSLRRVQKLLTNAGANVIGAVYNTFTHPRHEHLTWLNAWRRKTR